VTTPRFPLVLVDVSEDEADAASARLFDLGATGIEVRDATTLVKGKEGGETLIASFDDEETAAQAARNLPETWNPRRDAVVGDAWRDEYKKYFHPFELCPGVIVRPPWEAYAAKEGERVLTLEPGRAFGTGLHETTSLVAEVLSSHQAELRGRTILDVGTGSGILALLALVLGAERARAVDVDADAVRVAEENAEANGLSDRLVADTAELGTLTDRYPVIVANIEAGVLTELAPLLALRAQEGALVVLSGLLGPVVSGQLEGVLAAYARFLHVETRTKGEWVALLLRAPRDALP
jgi:ribosomal protein L11 methyltransferase